MCLSVFYFYALWFLPLVGILKDIKKFVKKGLRIATLFYDIFPYSAKALKG
jgi:hypothetical protein